MKEEARGGQYAWGSVRSPCGPIKGIYDRYGPPASKDLCNGKFKARSYEFRKTTSFGHTHSRPLRFEDLTTDQLTRTGLLK